MPTRPEVVPVAVEAGVQVQVEAVAAGAGVLAYGLELK